jgi:colanic acid biosynthesis glycosyl transferase WcaI
MNILIVTQYFWPENFRVNELVEELVKKGNEVTVLTGKPNYPEGAFYSGYRFWSPIREQYKGSKIIRTPMIPRGKRKWMLVLNYLSFALFGSLTGLIYCRAKYDVIFAFQLSPITVVLPGIVLKKIYKIKLVLWVQDIWPDTLEGVLNLKSKLVLTLVEKLVRFIYKHTDRILVTSEGFIQKIVTQGQRLEKLEYFPQWAESCFQPLKLNGENELAKKIPQGFVIMFAGNIGDAQSFGTIIGAAELLSKNKEIMWVILGEGRMKETFEKIILEKNLTNFRFLGQQPLETMPAYFSYADCMLVTLKKNPVFALTIPGKVQAYMACGKPIIAALDGEGKALIERANCGITANADDKEQLATMVLKMYQLSSKEREQLGMNGLSYAHQYFNRDRLIGRLEEIFRSIGSISAD